MFRAAKEDGFINPRKVTKILGVTEDEVASPPVQPVPILSEPSMQRLPKVFKKAHPLIRAGNSIRQKAGHTLFFNMFHL